MSCSLDSNSQMALLTLGQARFLTRLNLTILIYIALQRLEIFVVEIRDVCPVFENFCHGLFLVLFFFIIIGTLTTLGGLRSFLGLGGFCLSNPLPILGGW